MEVTGRQGRGHKQLLDGLKEMTGYCKVKQEALDRTVWRTCFGRGCGPDVRLQNDGMCCVISANCLAYLSNYTKRPSLTRT